MKHFLSWAFIVATIPLTFGACSWWYTPAPATPKPAGITVAEMNAQVRRDGEAKKLQRDVKLTLRVLAPYGAYCRSAALATETVRVAREYGVSPRIVAAVIAEESGCRASAVSPDGDVGLLQINTRVWHYSRKALLDPVTNLRVGTRILAGYVHRYGVVEGLHHYNGLGNPTDSYATKILEVANR
jgi:soluble lytic murein transglycosylase-like protein